MTGAFALATAFAVIPGSATAAPALAGSALHASDSNVAQVQYRRGGQWRGNAGRRGGGWQGRGGWRGPGVGFGLAAGALAGAALAAPYGGYGYYGEPGYDDDYNSGYAPRGCTIEGADGMFEPCDTAPN